MLNMQNYLIKSLAIVGTISLIIMACSADDANDTNSSNNNNSASGIGKYQITSGNGSGLQFYVIDTETGVVKSYSKNSTIPNSLHELKETIITQ